MTAAAPALLPAVCASTLADIRVVEPVETVWEFLLLLVQFQAIQEHAATVAVAYCACDTHEQRGKVIRYAQSAFEPGSSTGKHTREPVQPRQASKGMSGRQWQNYLASNRQSEQKGWGK